MRIKLPGFCFSVHLAASFKSNSVLSLLGILQPYAFKADTLNEYLNLSLKPSIIHEVSKIIVIINLSMKII